MEEKIIQRGAEATIFLENNLIHKNRYAKSYRLKIIDDMLRKSRTKSEAKILSKLQSIINVPRVIETNNQDLIIMEYIEGEKLSDHLEKDDWKEICKKIATTISKIHDQNIIHGDLTTSNMIFKDNQLFLIDFGLGFHSRKIEDKAVDLHLLKQALEAKHFTIAKECITIILENYRAEKADLIKERIKVIEKRGRYRH
jgi:TP53 regulating kinase and related kinases